MLNNRDSGNLEMITTDIIQLIKEWKQDKDTKIIFRLYDVMIESYSRGVLESALIAFKQYYQDTINIFEMIYTIYKKGV